MAVRRIGQRIDSAIDGADVEVVLELSIVDALWLGRVSATRRGLRARTSAAAEPDHTPASLQEVA